MASQPVKTDCKKKTIWLAWTACLGTDASCPVGAKLKAPPLIGLHPGVANKDYTQGWPILVHAKPTLAMQVSPGVHVVPGCFGASVMPVYMSVCRPVYMSVCTR